MFSERTARRLRDIVDDADHLRRFLDGLSFGSFEADLKTVLAVERLLQRITEAVIQIGPEEMTSIGPDIPVAKIRAFGNRLRHEYQDIERALVFSIARDDVPRLRDAAMDALKGR